MNSMGKINIAIAGVGNAASALLQSLHYYDDIKKDPTKPIGGIYVADIECVCAFDVAKGKVNKRLREAIFEAPNNCPKYYIPKEDELTVKVSKANVLDGISTDTGDAVRIQMQVPVILRTMIPKGLMGAMCAIMLAAFISTHDTYLHAWGSIFIQDVVMPFRKKPFEPKQHIKMLRWSIFGVAI